MKTSVMETVLVSVKRVASGDLDQVIAGMAAHSQALQLVQRNLGRIRSA